MATGEGLSHPLAQIPDSERRTPLTMGLVWITMVTGFPTVLIGFEWCKQGFSLKQVLVCALVSSLLLLAYTIPATQLSARSGLGYCGLARAVFGRWGTWLVTANIVFVAAIWYAMTAVWMANALMDLTHIHVSVVVLSIMFAFLMAFNNFFGFTGVANFARFFAAPALILWVGYTFIKALRNASPEVLAVPSNQTSMFALTTISSYVIGYAVWGNEFDYWRYSKPGTLGATIPLAFSLILGVIIFPVAGWLVARSSGVTDHAAATALINSYSFGSLSFGGIAVIGLIILTASYFAMNDSAMFGMVMAIESTWPMKHKVAVTCLAALSAVCAAFLSIIDSAKSLEAVAALNCIFAPTAAVIILTDWFLRQWLFKTPLDYSHVKEFSQLPAISWSAIIALFAGLATGVATSGYVPGWQSLHIGVCPAQAWLASAIVYAVLRTSTYQRNLKEGKLCVAKALNDSHQAGAATLDP